MSDSYRAKYLERLRLRGPDEFSQVHASLSSGTVTSFYHSRLRVTGGVASGSQPATSPSGRYQILFNGQIYNYRHLAQKYKIHLKRDTSDTEILTAVIDQIGVKASLDQICGMWALIVVDKLNESIYLSCDRSEIKPVFYHVSSDRLLAGSRADLIEGDPLCLSGLIGQIYYRAPINGNTIFAGAKKLKGGRILKVTYSSNLGFECIFSNIGLLKSTNHVPEDRLDSTWNEVIHDYSTSSGRSFTFLSGGIDSGLIAASLGGPKRSVCSISAGIKGDPYSEIHAAQRVSREIGVPSLSVELDTDEFCDSLVDYLRDKDQPLFLPNEVLLYRMAQLISNRGSKVVFSGEGADELFLGYDRIFNLAYQLDSQSDTTDPLQQIWRAYNYGPVSADCSIFNREFYELKETHAIAPFNDFFDFEQGQGSYVEALKRFFYRVHLPILNSRLDSATMAASVEARVPFLDERMIQFAEARKIEDAFTQNFEATGVIGKRCLRQLYAQRFGKARAFANKTGFPVNLSSLLHPDRMSNLLGVDLVDATIELYRQIIDIDVIADRFKSSNSELLIRMMTTAMWKNLRND